MLFSESNGVCCDVEGFTDATIDDVESSFGFGFMEGFAATKTGGVDAESMLCFSVLSARSSSRRASARTSSCSIARGRTGAEGDQFHTKAGEA